MREIPRKKEASNGNAASGGRKCSVKWARRFTLSLEPDHDLPLGSAPLTSFLYGQFDAAVFPISRWRECERAALSVSDVEAWGKDVIDEDDPMLVAQLRQHVLPRHGILARPENILITLGGQQGRYLVSQLFGGAGTTTGIEHPGMPDMAKILSLSPTRLRPLVLDDHGVVLGEQLRGCDTLILTCGHQCPTTAVMPIDRRKALLAQAERDDFIVVEDTFETELFSEPGHLPALKSMPESERVIHVASLSKLIAPGLRIGYVVADVEVIAQMRALRRLIHRHPPGNNQRALAIFIERGYYRAFLRRAQAVMAEREKAMIAALEAYVPQAVWSHCPGASTFWIRLPGDVDSRSMAAEAIRRGLLIDPGTRYFYAEDRGREYLRLSVSSIPAVRITDGIRRLARLLPDN
jgi:GntR family transcriptional regulator/MocR family aminotransferase